MLYCTCPHHCFHVLFLVLFKTPLLPTYWRCAVLCSTAFYCTKMCEKSESPSFIFYETKIQQSSSSWRVSLSFSKLQFITPKWIVKITDMLQEKNPGSSWQAILHLPWPLLPCLRHKTKWRRPLLKPPHHTLMLRRNRHCLKLPTFWPISWTISPKFILNCLLMIAKVFIFVHWSYGTNHFPWFYPTLSELHAN